MKGTSRLPEPFRADMPEITPETAGPRNLELSIFRTEDGESLVCLTVSSADSVMRAMMRPEDFMQFAEMVDAIRESLNEALP